MSYTTVGNITKFLSNVQATSITSTGAISAGGMGTFSQGLTVSNGLTVSTGTITLPAGSISQASVAGTIMNLTSAQSASGIKTFTNGLVIPTGGTITLPTGSISQASVDGTIMNLSTAQSALGIKTFTNGLVISTGGSITLPAGSISSSSIAGSIMDLTTAQSVSGVKTFTDTLLTNNVKIDTTGYTLPTVYNYLGSSSTVAYGSTTSVGNGTTNFAFNTTLNQGVYLVEYTLVLLNAVSATTITHMKHGLGYGSSPNISAPYMINRDYCYNYIPLNQATIYTGSFVMTASNTSAVYLLFTAVWTGTGTLSFGNQTTITKTRIG
jgi:hypothetical protein